MSTVAKRLSKGQYLYLGSRIQKPLGDTLWHLFHPDHTRDYAVSFSEAKRVVEQKVEQEKAK